MSSINVFELSTKSATFRNPANPQWRLAVN